MRSRFADNVAITGDGRRDTEDMTCHRPFVRMRSGSGTRPELRGLGMIAIVVTMSNPSKRIGYCDVRILRLH